MKQKVLIIGYVWVEPNSSAAGGRMLQIIAQFLNQNWDVTFASTAQKGEKAIDLKKIGVEEKAIALNSSSFDEFIKELSPQMVMFDRFMMEEQFGWRVADFCPNAIKILDTEDLHCLRKTREICHKKNQEFTKESLLNSDIAKREIASILRCDLSLMISTYEMDLLKNLFNIDESLIYYLPFLLPKIEEHQIKNWISFEKRKHFTMIGNFLHAPNVDAVLLLKKSIWKQIKKQLPEAELHVYGAYPTQQILELHNKKEGFLIKGYTKNPIEVVRNCKAVLAPLRFGAGIKGKLTEAMICGTPSITTSIGAEGMHEDFPWNGFITDDFDVFANKAVAIYKEKEVWQESQEKGITILNTIYDKEKIGTKFIAHLLKIKDKINILLL